MKHVDKRIPVILITGFLGSGKTTLVNHLLAGALGDGAGLLVNDFGDIAVDGSLIRRTADSGSGLDVFEVAGGSIFCSCKTDNFALGLRMFAKLQPERLIVEASGMSDPSGLDRIFADYRLASEFMLTKVICLADAVRTPAMMDNLPALSRQIEAADLILVNKSDLTEEANLAPFESRLADMNSQARILRTVYARIDARELEGGESSHHRGNIESCNTPSNRPGTMQLDTDGLPKDRIDAFLRDHLELTWRIKGWTEADGSWWYVSDNAGSIQWEESGLPEGMLPGLTVITPPGGEQAVAEAYRRMVGNEA